MMPRWSLLKLFGHGFRKRRNEEADPEHHRQLRGFAPPCLTADVGQRKMSSAYAYIAIVDPPGDPASVTDRLGISPTKIKRKGERLHGTMVQKTDCWILESAMPREDCDLDHHVGDLLARVAPKKKEIRKVVDESFGRLTLVGYFNHANDGFRLKKEHVALISEMGLEVDCDLYFLGEKEEPNQPPEPTSGLRPAAAHL